MLSFKVMLGLVLTVIALMGGAAASYLNVRNARGPKERAFVWRVCVVAWTVIVSMLLAVYFLPPPWRYFAAGGYFVVCPILVYRWATTHQLIRMVEERENADPADK